MQPYLLVAFVVSHLCDGPPQQRRPVAGDPGKSQRWGTGHLSGNELGLQTAETSAGFVQVMILLGKAEPEQVFAAIGTEEGASRNGGHAGGGEQIARLLRSGVAGETG